MIERIFQILAVVLIGIAAWFLWSGSKDYGFVTAVLACLAFFMSIRFQVKERNRERETAAAVRASEDESPEDSSPAGN